MQTTTLGITGQKQAMEHKMANTTYSEMMKMWEEMNKESIQKTATEVGQEQDKKISNKESYKIAEFRAIISCVKIQLNEAKLAWQAISDTTLSKKEKERADENMRTIDTIIELITRQMDELEKWKKATDSNVDYLNSLVERLTKEARDNYYRLGITTKSIPKELYWEDNMKLYWEDNMKLYWKDNCTI